MEYILNKYGNGKLAIPVDAYNYADYLYFLHFANGYFMPTLGRYRIVTSAGLSSDSISATFVNRGFKQSLQIIEGRVSKYTWLAGEEFTAADIMTFFGLTTWRLFSPYSLEGYSGILAYMKRIGEREGYQHAMEKADPGFTPMLTAENPEPLMK